MLNQGQKELLETVILKDLVEDIIKNSTSEIANMARLIIMFGKPFRMVGEERVYDVSVSVQQEIMDSVIADPIRHLMEFNKKPDFFVDILNENTTELVTAADVRMAMNDYFSNKIDEKKIFEEEEVLLQLRPSSPSQEPLRREQSSPYIPLSSSPYMPLSSSPNISSAPSAVDKRRNAFKETVPKQTPKQLERPASANHPAPSIRPSSSYVLNLESAPSTNPIIQNSPRNFREYEQNYESARLGLNNYEAARLIDKKEPHTVKSSSDEATKKYDDGMFLKKTFFDLRQNLKESLPSGVKKSTQEEVKLIQQNFTVAISLLNTQLENPTLANAYYQRGAVYRAVGQTDKADTDFAKALDVAFHTDNKKELCKELQKELKSWTNAESKRKSNISDEKNR